MHMYPLPCVRSFVHASVIISQERKKKGVSQGARQRLDRDNKREKTETVQTKKDHHVERNKQTAIKLATYRLRFIIHGWYAYVSVVIHRVFVRLFVRACVRHHITREKEEGSKSRRPTEARQGQQLRENRNSPNQERPSRRNEQTNHNQACHLQPEIHHSWVCMYPLSSCVRPFV